MPAIPADYGDAAAEYQAVRRGAGLVDRSDFGVLEVTGRDRATFLHAMLSQDIKSLTPGRGAAASLLDIHGKIQCLAAVWALDATILVVTPPGQAAKLAEALDKHLFAEKAYLRDATGELEFALVAGPEAPALVSRLADVKVPDVPWAHVVGTLGGVETRIVRGDGETGEPEVWLAAPTAHAEPPRSTLVEAGARPVGRTAFESLRIEAGTPVFGADADETVLLPEIPFEPRVSYSKGCYLGQEVVVRIRDRGHVNRMLRGLVLDGTRVPERGDRVTAGQAEIGHVTSAVMSFGLERPIALAFVRRQHAEPGTAVQVVSSDGASIPATVSALPFAR
ncbi:MAG: aminomethyl transferase family protein [Candidatus Rokubacteria bacterium]|nr:aminomethyl transferase family protein [Candidatus Rokubacteria bacterium]